MKIHVGEHSEIVLEEVFNPVVVRTEVGDFGICQRDGGIEIMCEGELVFASYTGLEDRVEASSISRT